MKKPGFLSRLKKEDKLELVEESLEVSKAYSIKSDQCLKSAKILFREKLYDNSVGEAYYAMYNMVLSLLFRCGIKCENHTGAVMLLGELFQLNELEKMLSLAKKERIDKQYYVTGKENVVLSVESAEQMVKDAEDFILGVKTFIGKLDSSVVGEVRERFATGF